MKLPVAPSRGDPLSADWGREVCAYLRALTPRPSPTVKVSMTTGGCTYEAAPKARPGSSASLIGNVTFLAMLKYSKAEGEAEPKLQVALSAGYRRIVGAGWEEVAATEFDFEAGKSLWMSYTYTTAEKAGEWSDVQFGDPEEETRYTRVIVFATCIDDDDGRRVLLRRLGDVEIFDLTDCSEPEDEEEGGA